MQAPLGEHQQVETPLANRLAHRLVNPLKAPLEGGLRVEAPLLESPPEGLPAGLLERLLEAAGRRKEEGVERERGEFLLKRASPRSIT